MFSRRLMLYLLESEECSYIQIFKVSCFGLIFNAFCEIRNVLSFYYIRSLLYDYTFSESKKLAKAFEKMYVISKLNSFLYVFPNFIRRYKQLVSMGSFCAIFYCLLSINGVSLDVLYVLNHYKPEFDSSLGFISLIIRVIINKEYIFINFPVKGSLLRLFYSK